MHRSRLAALGIDCRTDDLEAAARFWAEALGYRPKAPDPGGKYIMFEERPGEPQVFVQKVAHDPRVHLDIESDDIEAEVARLEALGAVVVDRIESWVVLEAPTGQRFCVVRPQRSYFPANATSWPD
jgi:predicted enzyme related to lactoylglutathione lyase